MRLVCTFEKQTLDLDAASRVEYSRRFVLSFANRIGMDGSTPYIGNNGNWWITDKDLGVTAAGGLKSFSTYLEFPPIGNSNFLYIDTSANKSYRWNDPDMHYYIVGSNYEDIEIINGGNA